MTVASSFNASRMAEDIGVRPTAFAVAAGFQGATPGVSITIAAAVLQAGIANYILFVNGNARDPDNPESMAPIPERPNLASEFLAPYGPAVAANTNYALLYSRHMHQYGTKPEQFARIAVNQRFNALENPLAALRVPLTVEDVLNSRYVNRPLHLFECVMPAAGGIAFIVTTAERARALKNP